MKRADVSQRSAWNAYVASHPHASFLQSWEWGEFQEALGRSVVRVFDTTTDGALRCVASGICHPLPLGRSYLFIPRGPIAWHVDEEKRLFSELALYDPTAVFIRFEPEHACTLSSCVKSRAIHPEKTVRIDLSYGEDSLLGAMHEKTRYNIRLASRKGASIDQKGSIDEFLFLLRQTAKRDTFSTHPDEHYRSLFSHFALPDGDGLGSRTIPHLLLYRAHHEGIPIAAALVLFFGDTATYLHGASSDSKRDMMASYLLHWHAMCDAKKAGYRYYDFWGIAPSDNPKHPWAGITRFKRGFGGEVSVCPGTYDYVVKPFFYRIYSAARVLSRFLPS